jgi:hypothetical protein
MWEKRLLRRDGWNSLKNLLRNVEEKLEKKSEVKQKDFIWIKFHSKKVVRISEKFLECFSIKMRFNKISKFSLTNFPSSISRKSSSSLYSQPWLYSLYLIGSKTNIFSSVRIYSFSGSSHTREIVTTHSMGAFIAFYFNFISFSLALFPHTSLLIYFAIIFSSRAI